MATRWQVTIDCADPAALAEFWALALGYEREPAPEGHASWEDWNRAHGIPPEEWDDAASIVDPAGERARIFLQRVPEPKIAKNRLHLDLLVGRGAGVPPEQRWARVTAEVARLTAAGAAALRQDDFEGEPHHVVMIDPEGNEFCVT
jgi:hypothetical protein